jgi:hypothetical protein
MDKFSMEVTNGVTDAIILPAQYVAISTNTLTSVPYRVATVPGGKYTNIAQLVAAVTQAFNSILITNIKSTLSTLDVGLFFLCWVDKTSGLVKIGFGSSSLDATSANLVPTNMTLSSFSGGIIYTPSSTGDFGLISTVPILRGGLQISFKFDELKSDTYANYNFEYGLCDVDTGSVVYGIRKQGGVFYSVNGDSEYPLASAAFNNNSSYTHRFYVDGGSLRYQIVTTSNDVVFTTPEDAFTGFEFLTSFNFCIKGNVSSSPSTSPSWVSLAIVYQSNIAQDTLGLHWDYPAFDSNDYLTLNALGLPPPRIIGLDFENGSQLQAGLGFSTTQFPIGVGSGAQSYSVTADRVSSFVDYYDLALQIPSLQLESYVATSDRSIGTRMNNICYFVPLLTSNTNKLIYTYDNKELVYVSLSNREAINMTTMQFRVIFTNTLPKQPWVQCNEMSFNLYIQEPPLL